MAYEAEKAAYDEYGFVIVRNLLDPADFAALRDNLDRYVREVVPTLPDTEAFFHERGRPETLKQLNRMGHDAWFRDYVQHPRWKALAEALVGEPCTVDQPEWFNKPPGTRHVTPPHQDNYYFCLEPSHVVTLWMALDAVDAENGCLRYVEGSHLRGYRRHVRSKILGFSQGDRRLHGRRLHARGGRDHATGRRGRPSRDDDSPRRCQPLGDAASPFVCDGLSRCLLPSRRCRLRPLPRLRPRPAL